MKLHFLMSLCLLFPFFAVASIPDCTISETELQEYLKMDYQSFDQSLPDGGWRGIANRGCNFEAGKLIDIYHLQNIDNLLAWQSRILFWLVC